MKSAVFLGIAAVIICCSAVGCADSVSNCSENDVSCVNNTVSTCRSGVWTVITECSASQVCNNETRQCENKDGKPDSALQACKNNEKKCKDNSVFECMTGQWVRSDICDVTQFCDSTNYTCQAYSPECANGARRCQDAAIYTCVNNRWDLGFACKTDIANAKYACDESSLGCTLECESGYILNGVECIKPKDGKPCKAGDEEILDGGQGCADDNTIAICSNGTWVDKKLCPAPENGTAVCHVNKCSYTCPSDYEISPYGMGCIKKQKPCTEFGSNESIASGYIGCISDTEQARCEDGVWAETKNCTVQNGVGKCTNHVCNYNCNDGYKLSNAYECINSAQTCEGWNNASVEYTKYGCIDDKTSALCKQSGTWDNKIVCPFGCISESGSCFEPTIPWCQFVSLDPKTKMAYVQVIKSQYELKSSVYCTDDKSKKLSEWQKSTAKINNKYPAQNPNSNNNEYMADAFDLNNIFCAASVSIVGGGEWLCPTQDPQNDPSKLLAISADKNISINDDYISQKNISEKPNWCIMKHVASDKAYMQFVKGFYRGKPLIRCTPAKSDGNYGRLSEWISLNMEINSGFNVENNDEYSGTMPQEAASNKYVCVSLFKFDNGTQYICPVNDRVLEDKDVISDNDVPSTEYILEQAD